MKDPYSLIVVEFVILNNFDHDITYFQSPISCAKSMISSGGHSITDQDLLDTHLLYKVNSLIKLSSPD